MNRSFYWVYTAQCWTISNYNWNCFLEYQVTEWTEREKYTIERLKNQLYDYLPCRQSRLWSSNSKEWAEQKAQLYQFPNCNQKRLQPTSNDGAQNLFGWKFWTNSIIKERIMKNLEFSLFLKHHSLHEKFLYVTKVVKLCLSKRILGSTRKEMLRYFYKRLIC